MKIRKIILSSVLLLLIVSLTNICNAYTISMNDIKAKKGEEFTFTINVDEETPFANGHIKFDSSKLEYLGAEQENLNQNLVEDGDVAWMYVDLEAQGTKSFEFKFKVKEDGESQISLEDLAFADVNGNTYENEEISGNTTIKVNSENEEISGNTTIKVNSENTSKKIIIIIVIIVVIILVIALCFINKKKRSKKNK